MRRRMGGKIPPLRLKCRASGYCSISKAKEKKGGRVGGDLSEQPMTLFELHMVLMRASIRIQALEVQT